MINKEIKNVIWTSDFNVEDWEYEFVERGLTNLSYDEKWSYVFEWNSNYLEDEMSNLHNSITNGEIICIGRIQCWDGYRDGYKLLGHCIGNIPNQITLDEFYTNGKDLLGIEHHHDGTNTYIFRELKGNTHDECVANAEKLFNGKGITPQRIGRYTKSLVDYVNEVYEW